MTVFHSDIWWMYKVRSNGNKLQVLHLSSTNVNVISYTAPLNIFTIISTNSRNRNNTLCD